MGGRGGSMGGSHGMGGGGGAAKAAAPKAPAQTREQQLLARIKGNPAAIMQMSDQDAADTVDAIAKQSIAHDGTQNDTFSQRYLNVIGFNDSKPQLLGDRAYEQARMKAKEASLYHAARSSHGKTGEDYNQQLLKAPTAFSSNGYYGGGTYWAWGSASESAEYGRFQVKGFLNSKARVITVAQLDNLGRRFSQSHPKTYARLLQANAGYGGKKENLYSFLAASHGYNIIQNGSRRFAGMYMVALDRSALTMSSKTISNASARMSNW